MAGAGRPGKTQTRSILGRIKGALGIHSPLEGFDFSSRLNVTYYNPREPVIDPLAQLPFQRFQRIRLRNEARYNGYAEVYEVHLGAPAHYDVLIYDEHARPQLIKGLEAQALAAL
jgi:hypothetical protein